MDAKLIQTTTDEEFLKESLRVLVPLIQEPLGSKGRCVLGLSGGSTPRPIYEALGKVAGIDWPHVSIFLIDERHVPVDHPDSNQKLVRDTLLAHAPIAQDHCVFPNTALPIADCVFDYESRLNALFVNGFPDAIVLGLGEDGHTASLFPPVIESAFGERLAIHTETDKFAIHDRISVSARVLKESAHPVFFLKGEGKKKTWEQMLKSKEGEKRWPAKALQREVTVVGEW